MIEHKHTKLDSRETDEINNLAKDDEVMHNTGAETVAGVKTHTSIPILPASSPTADNEATRKKYVDDLFPDFTIGASTRLIDSADDVVAIDDEQASYIKVKEVTYNEVAGTITVKFDLKDDNGSGGCFGRVYINDVAQGVEREETTGNWVTYEEDFSVNQGDEVQLYVKYDNGAGGVGGNTRNFRMLYKKFLDITASTINLD